MAFIRCVTQEDEPLVTAWKDRLFLHEGIEPAGTREYREGVYALSAIVAQHVQNGLVRRNVAHESGEGVLLVPVMVAGLGMLFPFLEAFPEARVGPIWPEHVVTTDVLQPIMHKVDLSMRRKGDVCIILDQVSATGHTLRCAIDVLSVVEEELQRILIATLFTSEHAIQRFAGRHDFYAIDGHGCVADNHMLNPGPGDTGRRWRGMVPVSSVPRENEERRAQGSVR